MKPIRLLLLLACAAPVLAHAQWQWVDSAGRKVFSDRPPPADVPPANILRQPGARPSAAPAAEATAAAPAAAPAPRVSGKDKLLEEKKKQAEAAEAEKKRAEAERIAKLKAENCTRAQQARATLTSGQRVAITNAKGEIEFMDDATKAAEVKRVEGVIASDCKPAS